MFILFAEICVVVSPAVLLAVLGLAKLFRWRLSESIVANVSQGAGIAALSGAVCVLGYMLISGARDVPLELGNWVVLEETAFANYSPDELIAGASGLRQRADHLPAAASQASAAHTGGDAATAGHFHFRLKFVFDRLSVPFVIMSIVLCSVIGAFAFRYMHLEKGYHRFFLYYAIFQLGMVLSSLAGTIETLFLGWELVGLSSALLVAFFHDRPAPVMNGLRVWSVYRIADAAFLLAALMLHHLSGTGDFEVLTGNGDWPFGRAALSSHQALIVGSLLLIAAAGKSALVPFSSWLPRAMEGPTPSSAVFYGALSVHLGAFLLLRVSPVLAQSQLLCGMVVAVGVLTLFFAAASARMQTDVKSALSYASLIQVSIIVIEIGCGLRYIALIHIVGHACVRTLQLVRAPSLLKDINALENALGNRLPQAPSAWERWLSPQIREAFYRFAWERGYLDSILDDWVVRPFVAVFRWSDQLERTCTSFLAGTVPKKVTTDADGVVEQ